MRFGTTRLNIPRLRDGICLPSFIMPRRDTGKPFAAVIEDARVYGVSIWLR